MNRSHSFAYGYLAVTFVLIVATAFVMGEVRTDPQNSYTAEFGDVSGLRVGDQVKAAGVAVGTVRDIDLRDDETVTVAFTAAKNVELDRNSTATIRYRTMTGNRYLEIARPSGGTGRRLPTGGVIPLAQTSPGLDLDSVFNGFKPLVRGLDPREVNQVSAALVGIFQGDDGNVELLMENVSTLVTTLAGRSEVIGELITNFDVVLETLGSRDEEITSTLKNVRELAEGLEDDRVRFSATLHSASVLAEESAAFLEAVRPPVERSVNSIEAVMAAVNTNLDLLETYLTTMPIAYSKATRVSAYGSFYNMYVCGASLLLDAPGGGTIKTPMMLDKSERCQMPKDDR